jgi:hypothetical protein
VERECPPCSKPSNRLSGYQILIGRPSFRGRWFTFSGEY